MIVFGRAGLDGGRPEIADSMRHANAGWIARAVALSEARPSGGWFVLDGSRRITSEPRAFEVAGKSLVVFRGRSGRVIAGPERCPHLGAALSGGRVDGEQIICPWHGMRMGGLHCETWPTAPVHDDGVLVWVRLDSAHVQPTERPILPKRPSLYVDATLRIEARCDPRDVLSNRFDPWHGVHLHPYAFARLDVLELGADHVVVRVIKRVAGALAIQVDARFDSPDPRTIVMTIVGGEGLGSVVETHATPIGPGRTAIIEASLASSPRSMFRFARPLSRVIRPLLERSARRLWLDDATYVERLYQLREARLGDVDRLPPGLAGVATRGALGLVHGATVPADPS